MRDQLDAYITEHAERWTEELRELCAIASEATDPSALQQAADWCEQRLRAAGCETRQIALDGVPSLVVGETGAGARTLIGVQHYDVQPAVPLELWTTPPYDPAVRDGAVYARGVDDNKGHLLLRIQAVEAYRAVFGELPIRMRFLIEGEEESGSASLGRLLATDDALTDGDGALKEGGSVDSSGRPQLLLGGKGILYAELRVRTLARDAHSGGATHLPNAAWRLVDALSTLMDVRGRVRIQGFYDDVRDPSAEERAHVAALPFDADEVKRIYGLRGFAFGRGNTDVRLASQFEPTCNICGIVSGFIDDGTKTVIPAEASCKIDFRLVPDQDPERIAALVRAHLDRHGFGDIESVYKEGTRPYRGRRDDPLVRAVKAAAEEAFGKDAHLVPTSGGTSPMWTVCHRRALANVTLGMGHPGSAAHAPDENIILANYWKAIRATARLYSLYATQA
ncbi:MAG: M20/M25/M40 family metallo-hydrolase [Solirubrobacterales bacterium]|nr:M20/M25/M40 family metallo-hydrolase [Solirubrobacterales bacterium]